MAQEIERKIYDALGVEPASPLGVIEARRRRLRMAPKRRLPPARWRRSRPPSVRRTEAERAIDLAYKAVARRDLTVAELRTRLERKHVPPEAIDEAVAELEETGFLDDARYARQFAEDKRELEQWGPTGSHGPPPPRHRPAADRRRGLDARPRLGARTALLLLKERYKQARDDRDRDRAWQMLVRRGYSPDLAYDAIKIWERAERERRRAA